MKMDPVWSVNVCVVRGGEMGNGSVLGMGVRGRNGDGELGVIWGTGELGSWGTGEVP